MKKFVIPIICLALLLALTGCIEEPSRLEVTDSNGEILLEELCGQDRERAIEACVLIEKPEGQRVTVHFTCEDCGHDETIKMEAPWALLFSCQCREYKTRYFALAVGDKETLHKATEKWSQ